MDHRAQGDALQGQGVADVDLDVVARHHLGAHRQAVRPEDVSRVLALNTKLAIQSQEG